MALGNRCGRAPVVVTQLVRAAGIMLTVRLLLSPGPTIAQPATAEAPPAAYPMPKTPSPYTTPQPAGGMDSQTGIPGRTLGLESICGSCQLEKFTDECV